MQQLVLYCTSVVLENWKVLECSAGSVLEQYWCSVPDARSHLRARAKLFQNRSHFSLQKGTPYLLNFLLSLAAATILEQCWSNTGAATGVVLHWCSTGTVLEQYWDRTETILEQYWCSTGTVVEQR